MKVCLVLFAGAHSGIAQYSHELSKSLSKCVDKTVLVLNRHFPHDGFENLAIVKPFSRTRTILLDLLKFFYMIFREKPDIVHIQNFIKNPFLTWIIALVVESRGAKVIFTAHDVRPHYEKPWDEFFLRKLYNAVDGVIVHSSNNMNTLSGLCDHAGKSKVIPHGVYDFYNDDAAITREEARSRLGLPMSGKILLYFGVMDKRKGAEALIREAPRLIEKNRDLLLLFSGKDRFPEGYLHNLARESGVEDHVLLFDRWIPEEEVKYYFLSADAVILPYLEGSTSGVLKVAFAFDKKVIATRVGEFPEQLNLYSKGLLIDIPPSDEDIANISGFLESNGLPEKNDAFIHRMSWDNIAALTASFYSRIME